LDSRDNWELLLCTGAEHLEEEFIRAGYSTLKSERNYDGSRKFTNSDVYTRIAAVDRLQAKRVCLLQSFTCSGERSVHNFTTADRLVEALQALDILQAPLAVTYGPGEQRDFADLRPPAEIVLVALHMPFSKQDQVYSTGECNAGRMAVRTLFAAGLDHMVVVDPHVPLGATWFREYTESGRITVLSMYDRACRELSRTPEHHDMVLVATPGKQRSPQGQPLPRIDKTRISTHEVRLEGEMDPDLKDRRLCLVDDMVLSGTTVKDTRRKLLDQGAGSVYAWVTHALPEHSGEENLRRLVDAFDERVYVSNSVRSDTFARQFPECSRSVVPVIIAEFLEQYE